jgi:hypothetical protein
MSAAMQAYIAVRQGRLMERWLPRRSPLPVYVWNADQDVCLASFILEYHELLEHFHSDPMLRWIVQFNNKIDVCGGLYPVDLTELVRNHFTWVFEPYRNQRMRGKTDGDEALVKHTIRQVCDRLADLLRGRAGIAPITAEPEILYTSPSGFIIADEKGDPHSRLVLASQGHTKLISLVCRRETGRYTYSVIRGSAYDEDIFDVTRLIQAFQAAEDVPQPRIWGGSTLAAGSDSELGSSLHWTQIRDIAERVVLQTSTAMARHSEPKPSRLLVVMNPDESAPLHALLQACGAEVCIANSCAEARRTLAADAPFSGVFSACHLADGGFEELVRICRRRTPPTPVTVCLPQIDGGWIDLLEAGAFDVMVEPYRRDCLETLLGRLRLYAEKQPAGSRHAATEALAAAM